MHTPGTSADSGPQTALPGAHISLALLLAINLFNYIDRQILAGVLPRIEQEFLKGDVDAKAKLGWLTTAFLVAYMVLSPLFGWMGDRMSRWLLVGVGVILWSLASGASGLAEGYVMLLLTRCFVGVGEAAYGPTAPGVISDLYPVKVRGSKLAWFYAAIPVGGALGYVLGGTFADTALGWRWAFYLVVPPGIALGVLCLLMREPPRGQADAGTSNHRKATLKDYWILAETPSYVLNTLGMTALTFAVGGIAVWMPTYIYEREARWELTGEVLDNLGQGSTGLPADTLAKLQVLKDKEFRPVTGWEQDEDGLIVAQLKACLSPTEFTTYEKQILDASRTPKLGFVNILFGAIVVISGFAATILGGIVGDGLRSRFSGSYFLVSGFSMLIAFPMLLFVIWLPFPLGWLFIFFAVFALFFNTGPTNTILANVTHPAMRATGFAVNIFVIHVLGDVVSPVLMGWIWDMRSLERSTARNLALVVVSIVVLLGGVLWLWGARYLKRDTELAPTRIGPQEVPAVS
jgi:MFS transporter, Spinster family, sphingosine-1-phosphate transporter